MHGSREITIKHRRLAEIIEMIHTASLIHDDVLDESNLRRGRPVILLQEKTYNFTDITFISVCVKQFYSYIEVLLVSKLR